MSLLNSLFFKIKLWNRYYMLIIPVFSLFTGSLLFYLSWLRQSESGISPVTMYCLEKRDIKVCSQRNLKNKRLRNKEIKKIIFTRCFCESAGLFNVRVSDSDFRENNLSEAALNNVLFFKVNLFKSLFYGAILNNVVFEESDLRGVVFNFASFENVQFKKADLRSALFIGARFKNTWYDRETKLPFSEEQARRIGLLAVKK